MCLLASLSIAPLPAAKAAPLPPPTLETAYTFPGQVFPTGLVYGPGESAWLTLKTANTAAKLPLPASLPSDPTLVTLPDPAALPFDITIGADANLWLTERTAGKIARVDAASLALSEFPLENLSAMPSQIALGQDGGVWFTEFDHNAIGRIGINGGIDEYALPNANSQPLGIAAALDGSLWFTEWNGSRIGRIDPLGLIGEYAAPSSFSRPSEIALGPDGFIYFVYEIGLRLVRVDPASGAMTTLNLPYADIQSASILDLSTGPDGRLWLLGTDTVCGLTLTGGAVTATACLDLPDAVFSSQGRSQLIPGPGAEMILTNARSQAIQRVVIPGAIGQDLQVFMHPFPAVLLMGGAFELAFEFANWSASPATGITVSVPLPESINFIEAQSPRLDCAEIAGAMTCTLDQLAAHERLTVPFFFNFGRVPEETTTRSLAVTVTGPNLDPLAANNTTFRTLTFQRTIDHFYDFQASAGSEWSDQTLGHLNGDVGVLGGFDNQVITLTFPGLPHHDRADLCFDVYMLGGWDGASLVDPEDAAEFPEVIGPDLWGYYRDNTRLLFASFSNQPRYPQSFPSGYNQGVFPAQTKAASTGSYDHDLTVTDSRYHFCAFGVHTPAELKYTFYGAGLNGASGEQWALDNVSVRLYYYNVFDWLFLPVMQR